MARSSSRLEEAVIKPLHILHKRLQLVQTGDGSSDSDDSIWGDIEVCHIPNWLFVFIFYANNDLKLLTAKKQQQ